MSGTSTLGLRREVFTTKTNKRVASQPKVRFDTISQDRSDGGRSILLYALRKGITPCATNIVRPDIFEEEPPDNIVLEDLSCSCGHRYWDIFQDRFVKNSRDRTFSSDGRALPMPNEEAMLKRDMTLVKFEASIRASFTIHRLSCGIRRRMDDGEAEDEFDTPGLLRDLGEKLKFIDGDYSNRNTSRSFLELAASSLSRTRPRRQPSLSSPAPDATLASKNLATSEATLRSNPRPQREALPTRVDSTSIDRDSGINSASHPALPDSITTTDVDPAVRDTTLKRMRRREESSPDSKRIRSDS